MLYKNACPIRCLTFLNSHCFLSDQICEHLFEKIQQQISISLVALVVSKVAISPQRLALQLVSAKNEKGK